MVGLTEQVFDVAVVGGGPAGLTHACYMALGGRKVILFEQAVYPRHQIGESLLPFSWDVFEEIQFADKLKSAGFVEKHGARFYSERSHRGKIFRFANSLNPKYPTIYHVGRDVFDEMLRDHAISLGVQVIQPHAVRSVTKDKDGIPIDNTWRAKILVRASGITTAQVMPENYVPNAPEDNATGVYSYFKYTPKTGTILDGDILIDLFYVDDASQVPCWAWAIPISQDIMSVGFVLRTHQFAKIRQEGLSLNEMGQKMLKLLPEVCDIIDNVDEPLDDYRMRFNFQRVAKQIVFDREVLIGDAAGFIDPVFSSGVHIGLNSARLSAMAINEALSDPASFNPEPLEAFQTNYRHLFWSYYRFVKMFYEKNLVEKLFLMTGEVTSETEDKLTYQLANEFTSILSGDIASPNSIIRSLDNARLTINPDVRAVFEGSRTQEIPRPNMSSTPIMAPNAR